MHVVFFGGEPTINSEGLLAALNYLQTNNIPANSHLMTNGIIKKSLLTHLLKTNIMFQVSYDGQLNNLRKFNNGNDATSQTIETLKTLADNEAKLLLRVTVHGGNVTDMPNIVHFAAEHGIKKIAFAPICQFGDAKRYGISQAEIKTYVENLRQALNIAKMHDINIQVNEKIYPMTAKQNIPLRIPFVWLPDGSVAMTITYASAKLKNANSIIIGKFDTEQNDIILDAIKINKMRKQFRQHFESHCDSCEIRSLCRGKQNFTPYATNTFIAERDNYFCNLSKQIIHQLNILEE